LYGTFVLPLALLYITTQYPCIKKCHYTALRLVMFLSVSKHNILCPTIPLAHLFGVGLKPQLPNCPSLFAAFQYSAILLTSCSLCIAFGSRVPWGKSYNSLLTRSDRRAAFWRTIIVELHRGGGCVVVFSVKARESKMSTFDT